MSEGAEAVRLSRSFWPTSTESSRTRPARRARSSVASEREPGNAELRRAPARAVRDQRRTGSELAELVAGDADFASDAEEKVRSLPAGGRDPVAEAKGLRGGGGAARESASALKPDDRELLLELCDAYSASGRGKAAAAGAREDRRELRRQAHSRSSARSTAGSPPRTLPTATRSVRSKSSTRPSASSPATCSY